MKEKEREKSESVKEKEREKNKKFKEKEREKNKKFKEKEREKAKAQNKNAQICRSRVPEPKDAQQGEKQQVLSKEEGGKCASSAPT